MPNANPRPDRAPALPHPEWNRTALGHTRGRLGRAASGTLLLWVASGLAGGGGGPASGDAGSRAPTAGAFLTAPLVAQASRSEAAATPEEAAGHFIRSLRGVRWADAARFLDPEPLDDFRAVVTMITEVDASGAFLEYLTGTDATAYARLTSAEVFARALTALTDDMPGLTHSLYDRDDEILGVVEEGPDTAHVVYRTLARVSGAVPELKVMQLRRGPDGWRVFWSAELDVLETALRGARRLSDRGPAG